MRPPTRLLHASDLHLHWQQCDPALDCLRGLRDAAARLGAQAVLIAGDVFDTADQPADFVEAVAKEVELFPQPMVLIPGNYDIRYSADESDALGVLAELLPGRHRVLADGEGESALLLDGALHIWGRGMPEHSPHNDPLRGVVSVEDTARWSVAIAHGELTRSRRGMRSSPIVLDDHAQALRSVHYLALGHHDDSHIERFGTTVVCYSGSASSVLGSREFAVVDLVDPGGATVEIHRLGPPT